jgi:hypothetical protein
VQRDQLQQLLKTSAGGQFTAKDDSGRFLEATTRVPPQVTTSRFSATLYSVLAFRPRIQTATIPSNQPKQSLKSSAGAANFTT